MSIRPYKGLRYTLISQSSLNFSL